MYTCMEKNVFRNSSDVSTRSLFHYLFFRADGTIFAVPIPTLSAAVNTARPVLYVLSLGVGGGGEKRRGACAARVRGPSPSGAAKHLGQAARAAVPAPERARRGKVKGGGGHQPSTGAKTEKWREQKHGCCEPADPVFVQQAESFVILNNAKTPTTATYLYIIYFHAADDVKVIEIEVPTKLRTSYVPDDQVWKPTAGAFQHRVEAFDDSSEERFKLYFFVSMLCSIIEVSVRLVDRGKE